MTETEMREMVKDIIINGAEYEVKKCNRECNVPDDGLYCDCEYKRWVPYHLGEEIHLDWEYRKVEKWYVTLIDGRCDDFAITKNKSMLDIVFGGSKEDCEKWIEEHTKKTWLKDEFGNTCFCFRSSTDALEEGFNKGATKVCQKILEELEEKLEGYIDRGENSLISDIKKIIKDLGVEV